MMFFLDLQYLFEEHSGIFYCVFTGLHFFYKMFREYVTCP